MAGNERYWNTSRRERRINTIFDLLNQGKKADEIDAYLQSRMQSGREGKRIGDESERLAAAVLQKITWVQEAKVVSGIQKEDRRKHDLRVRADMYGYWVEFQEHLFIPEGIVWVQVASSDKEIAVKRKKLRQMIEDQPYDLKTWLCEERLVLLNGRNTEESIGNCFSSQLREINRYWQER